MLQVVCPTLPYARRCPSASELPSLCWLIANNVGCLRTLCLSRLWHNIRRRCVVNSLRGTLPSEVQSRLSVMWMLRTSVCWSSLPSSLEEGSELRSFSAWWYSRMWTSNSSLYIETVRYLSPPIAYLNRSCFTAAYESRKQTVTLSMIEYRINTYRKQSSVIKYERVIAVVPVYNIITINWK